MECVNCHADLPDTAKFCVECGRPAQLACLACGATCGAQANFCPECGARLASRGVNSTVSAPAVAQHLQESAGEYAERRQLTVLFCDLVSFTQMSSQLDPEDLRMVIGAYYRCVADTIGQFDGFVPRFLGDGALVYFGYPHGHEDNAARAVRASLALVANVGKLTTLGRCLEVRIGVATGLVVIGELANAGVPREQTVLGETPNLAARLQGLAEPNAIVIADSTKRLAGGRFTYRDLGDVAVKGFDAPMHVWEVSGIVRGSDVIV